MKGDLFKSLLSFFIWAPPPSLLSLFALLPLSSHGHFHTQHATSIFPSTALLHPLIAITVANILGCHAATIATITHICPPLPSSPSLLSLITTPPFYLSSPQSTLNFIITSSSLRYYHKPHRFHDAICLLLLFSTAAPSWPSSSSICPQTSAVVGPPPSSTSDRLTIIPYCHSVD